MEAVPATSGVRRTVRVATALVIGQVLLVAVIGWVTFTYAGNRSGRSAPAVDQLAAPPAVLPPPAAPARSATSNPASRSSATAAGRQRSRTTDPELPAVLESSGSGSPARTIAPATVVPPAPPAATDPPAFGSANPPSSAAPSPTDTASPAPSGTPSPVIRAGGSCTRIFAWARTADGWPVRCLPTRHHQLRWKIV